MSRREMWLSAAAVFAVAAIVRIVAAATVAFPVPEDTAYYAGVARNLVEGRGLVSDALWSYQTEPLAVPRAAFEVWMPLPTLLAAVPMAVLGTAHWFRAAQVFSILVSSGVAVLAWRLGADVAKERRLPVGRARTLAVGSGLVASMLGPLVLYGALPDSTAPFAFLSLAACLLMTRISAAPTGPRDRRLLALGAVLGLAALTRSEALWLGLAWLAVAWFATAGTRRERAILVAVPALIAAAFYAPWAIRDWLAFGNPLPGQSIANALFTNNFDVYAYRDEPTLARSLAQGPGPLLQARGTAFVHNVVNVLVIPGFPVGLVGIGALPLIWRQKSVRPLLIAAAITFLVTTLVFPVSTLWGTFLHAAGAIYVLLVISCLVALDALIAVVHRWRHWWRPVAWLGPAFAMTAALPLTFISIYTISTRSTDTEVAYRQLSVAMDRAGIPLDSAGTVITDSPIWLAEATRARAIALPEESPESVLALARQFHSSLLIVRDDDRREWPGVLTDGSEASQCFREVELTDNSGGKPNEESPLGQFHVFRIVCP